MYTSIFQRPSIRVLPETKHVFVHWLVSAELLHFCSNVEKALYVYTVNYVDFYLSKNYVLSDTAQNAQSVKLIMSSLDHFM